MRFLRVLMAAWIPVSLYAITPANVAELARIIYAEPAGRTDDKAALALADLRLTERLTDDTLARMIRDASGPKTRNALRALAVESTFFDPPANELPPQSQPLPAERKGVLARAVNYASGYIRALPDFICTIETRLSDDDNTGRKAPKWERFHPRDTLVSQLTFEAGHESYKLQTVNGKPPRDNQPMRGLTTWGEFGPQVAALLLEDRDAAFFWSHRETLGGNSAAVIRYSVDAKHSDYAVSWCCSSPTAGGKESPASTHAAYTGQLYIEPESGTILRLTRQTSDLPVESHIDLIQTTVEYRPVEISGKTYICPFRSISVSRETKSAFHDGRGFIPQTITYLNEVYFTRYRKFETDARLLPESASSDMRPATVASQIIPPHPEEISESAAEESQAPEAPTFGTTVVVAGELSGDIYYIHPGTRKLPNFRKMKRVGTIYTDSLNVPPRDFREGFPGLTSRIEWFAIDYTGRFWIEKPGVYGFSMQSDDGSILYIDDQVVIDNDGVHPPKTLAGSVNLSGGIHRIRVSYFQGPRWQVALKLSVQAPDEKLKIFKTSDFSPPATP
jgi:hypothetical protein